jgi:hypothetical protein
MTGFAPTCQLHVVLNFPLVELVPTPLSIVTTASLDPKQSGGLFQKKRPVDKLLARKPQVETGGPNIKHMHAAEKACLLARISLPEENRKMESANSRLLP